MENSSIGGNGNGDKNKNTKDGNGDQNNLESIIEPAKTNNNSKSKDNLSIKKKLNFSDS